jgi:hypothetical protein
VTTLPRSVPRRTGPHPRAEPRTRAHDGPRTLRRSAALLAALGIAALGLFPGLARSEEPEREESEIVAEALFLYDALPPAGRDLNLTLTIEEGGPDATTGRTEVAILHQVQLALPLGDRAGFTVDIGTPADGDGSLDDARASLKLLLRAPRAVRTGVAVSVDLFGSSSSLAESEIGFGVGAIRGAGPFAFRAGAGIATRVSSWSPHLSAGVSAAVVLGARWRALLEITTDVDGGEAVVSAGPTLKVELSERTALMAGALFQVSPGPATPGFTIQLARSL